MGTQKRRAEPMLPGYVRFQTPVEAEAQDASPTPIHSGGLSQTTSAIMGTWPFSALKKSNNRNQQYHLSQRPSYYLPQQASSMYDYNDPSVSTQLICAEDYERMIPLQMAFQQPLGTIGPMAAGAGGSVHMLPRPIANKRQHQQQQQPQLQQRQWSRGKSARSEVPASLRQSIISMPGRNFVFENFGSQQTRDAHHHHRPLRTAPPADFINKNSPTGIYMSSITPRNRQSVTGFNQAASKLSMGSVDRLAAEECTKQGLDASNADNQRQSPFSPLSYNSPESQPFSPPKSPTNKRRTDQTQVLKERQYATVPLVGSWTINRWLAVLAENTATTFMVWSIYPYSAKKKEHVSNKGRLMFSQIFTTTRGYKMRCMVALNGTGQYTGKYISIFWQILPSHDDDSLPWPMKETITVRVLPAGSNEAFTSTSSAGYTRSPKSFARPTGGRPTPPWGFKKFINHSYLESGHFIQADTLWLAFEITEAGAAGTLQAGKGKRKSDGLFGDFVWRLLHS